MICGGPSPPVVQAVRAGASAATYGQGSGTAGKRDRVDGSSSPAK
jgi:hypothetical protein